jgi:hypothetical protein
MNVYEFSESKLLYICAELRGVALIVIRVNSAWSRQIANFQLNESLRGVALIVIRVNSAWSRQIANFQFADLSRIHEKQRKFNLPFGRLKFSVFRD